MIIVISFLTIQPRVSDITTEINIPEIFYTTTINSIEVEDGEAGTTIFPESVTEQPVTNGTAPVGKKKMFYKFIVRQLVPFFVTSHPWLICFQILSTGLKWDVAFWSL